MVMKMNMQKKLNLKQVFILLTNYGKLPVV